MLRETMLVCRDVASSEDWAMLSAVVSDMRISGCGMFGPVRHGPAAAYLFRLTSTSISSEPVWNTLELAV